MYAQVIKSESCTLYSCYSYLSKFSGLWCYWFFSAYFCFSESIFCCTIKMRWGDALPDLISCCSCHSNWEILILMFVFCIYNLQKSIEESYHSLSLFLCFCLRLYSVPERWTRWFGRLKNPHSFMCSRIAPLTALSADVVDCFISYLQNCILVSYKSKRAMQPVAARSFTQSQVCSKVPATWLLYPLSFWISLSV